LTEKLRSKIGMTEFDYLRCLQVKSKNTAGILKELVMKYCDIQHVSHWSLQGWKEEMEEEEKEENIVRCISFEKKIDIYIDIYMKCDVEDRGLKGGDWENKLLWKLKTTNR
jgi:hypothetical protein